MEADKDRDGKISFDEFTKMVENTDVSMSMTLGKKNRNSREEPSVPGLCGHEARKLPYHPSLKSCSHQPC